MKQPSDKAKKHPWWKRILAPLFLWILFPLILIAFLPLIYLGFLLIMLIVPPFAYFHVLHDKWQEKTPFSVREEVLRLFSYLLIFPLALFAIVAILRSLTLFAFSLWPPALVEFQRFHHETIYHWFIPWFGDQFPYWLDLWWGAGGVVVLLAMAIYDAWKRSTLVRQIKLMPTSKVQSAAIGLVELKGRAVPYVPTEKGPIMRSWTEISDDGLSSRSFARPFYLDDGTGRVLIDPQNCGVNQSDSMFSINIHQAVLQQESGENNLSEGRLMPGESVYVLGNLQTNDDPEFASEPVVVRPAKSTLFHPGFQDVFFVSDKSKAALLEAFHRVSRRGWLNTFVILFIAGWMAIYAWTNITQISFQRLDAAPAVFRMLTPATDLERELPIGNLGTRPVISWIEGIETGSSDTDEIMYLLREQQLAHLAVPALSRQALDIHSAGFASANVWLRKLERYPSGVWAHQFFKDEHLLENISRKPNTEAFVYRVMLRYDAPVLNVSWKAWFSEFESEYRKLATRYVVFSFTDIATGQKYVEHIPLGTGWTLGENDRLFENIPPGRYEFFCHVRRIYEGGARDRGSRTSGKFEIDLM